MFNAMATDHRFACGVDRDDLFVKRIQDGGTDLLVESCDGARRVISGELIELFLVKRAGQIL